MAKLLFCKINFEEESDAIISKIRSHKIIFLAVESSLIHTKNKNQKNDDFT